MLRPVSSLQLPRLAILELHMYGFTYIEDILRNEDSKKEASTVLRKWGENICNSWERFLSSPKSETAAEIWQQENDLRSIITFCEQVDNTLNGGIPLRKVTEFCGAPGSGKTQFCLQLCVSVQLPKCLGGLAGEAVYIDTDSGFSPSRLEDIAKSCVAHCEMLMREADAPEEHQTFNVETILGGVHYIAVNNFFALQRTVSVLEDFIHHNRKIHLIILDNLSFIFRYGSEIFNWRTKLICGLLSNLQYLASKFNLAVVVTNHLTTNLEVSAENKDTVKGTLMPALGVGFAHMVGLRLILGSAPRTLPRIIEGHRPFSIIQTKSVDLPQSSAFFEIDEGGIRDVNWD